MTFLLALALYRMPFAFAEHAITCGPVTIYPGRIDADPDTATLRLEYQSWLLRRRKFKTGFGTVYPTPTGYHATGEFYFGGTTYIPTLEITREPNGSLHATLHHFDSEAGDLPPTKNVRCVETRPRACAGPLGG